MVLVDELVSAGEWLSLSFPLTFPFAGQSQPSLLFVPADGLADAVGERPLRFIAQLAASRLDVAVPVALSQDVVFVHVQRRQLAQASTDGAIDGADGSQEPEGRFDMEHATDAHFLLKQVAEGSAVVAHAV